MRISLIAAASANNVIGNRGELPWHLPRDLKRFKEVTMGKPIVMGRLTWDSIGRPLPNRQNIVISRNPDFEAPGCDIVATPDDAVDMAGRVDELMIIGGGQLYSARIARVSNSSARVSPRPSISPVLTSGRLAPPRRSTTSRSSATERSKLEPIRAVSYRDGTVSTL